MAVDRVPYFIGIPGVKHSGEIVRQDVYDSTGGSEGVSSPASMRVTASPAADKYVRVAPGGAILVNWYAGADGQSYSARNATQTLVEIPATGSGGGRTDILVLRILDPQYEGQMPADPNNFDYTRFQLIQGVSATAKTAGDLNLDYPAIALARITRPLNRTIVQPGDITDLRQLAQPKEHTEIVARPTLTSDPAAGMLLTSTHVDGEWFPNAGGDQRIDVPSWANRMQIEATWIGVLYGPEQATGWGDYWVDYGPVGAAGVQKLENSTHKFRWDAPKGDYNRANWVVAQDVPVPANMRGKSGMQFIMKARRDGGTITCKMDHRSGIIFKVRFMQVATLSDS